MGIGLCPAVHTCENGLEHESSSARNHQMSRDNRGYGKDTYTAAAGEKQKQVIVKVN